MILRLRILTINDKQLKILPMWQEDIRLEPINPARANPTTMQQTYDTAVRDQSHQHMSPTNRGSVAKRGRFTGTTTQRPLQLFQQVFQAESSDGGHF